MGESSLPPWWMDIQRSSNNALQDYESVLDSFDYVLHESGGVHSGGKALLSEKWITLESALSAAVERVEQSFRLADSRRRDAELMGLCPPDDHELRIRSSRLSGRSKQLRQKIQSRMNLIEEELSSRTPRRPGVNLYRGNTPSYIDVRV